MSYLLSIDLFGVQKKWKLFGHEEYKTKMSSFFSIIVIIIFLYKIYITLDNIFKKKSYSQKLYYEYSNRTNVNISNFKMAFCSTKDWMSTTNWDDNFSITFNITKKNYSYIHKVEEKCDLNDNLIVSNYSLDFFKNCYCFNMPNDSIIQDDIDIYTIMNIRIHNLNYNKTDSMKLILIYLESYFKYDDEDGNIFKYADDYIASDLQYGNMNFFELNFYKSKFISKFDFELKDYIYREMENYQIMEHITSHFYHDYKEDKNLVFWLNLMPKKKLIIYEITIFNIDLFFAAFGGFFQLVYFFFSIFCNMYNDYHIDREILKYYENKIETSLKPISIKNNIIRDNNENKYFKTSFMTNRSHHINTKFEIEFNNVKRTKQIKLDYSKIFKLFDFKYYLSLCMDVLYFKKIFIHEDDLKLFDYLKFNNYYNNNKIDNSRKNMMNEFIRREINYYNYNK